MKRNTRRLLTLILALMVCAAFLTLGLASFASAETVQATASTFDATPIVAALIVLIGVALGSFLLWLTYKYIVPLLKVPIVGTVAKWAVDLAEKTFGSGNGDAKFEAAAVFVTKALKTIKINVDQDQIKAAIISAWTALNLAQIAAGIKSVTIDQKDEATK